VFSRSEHAFLLAGRPAIATFGAATATGAAYSVFSLTEHALFYLPERIHALLKSLRDSSQARSALEHGVDQIGDAEIFVVQHGADGAVEEDTDPVGNGE